MVARFLMFFILFTACVYVGIYTLTREERKWGAKIAFRIVISAIVAAFLVTIAFLANYVSGV